MLDYRVNDLTSKHTSLFGKKQIISEKKFYRIGQFSSRFSNHFDIASEMQKKTIL